MCAQHSWLVFTEHLKTDKLPKILQMDSKDVYS